MTNDAPFPMTSDLLEAHPVYARARAVLTVWYGERLDEGPPSAKAFRSQQLERLGLITGQQEPESTEWYWQTDRALTISWLLYELVRCTHHEEPEERMEGWAALQRAVRHWDERFANGSDVA